MNKILFAAVVVVYALALGISSPASAQEEPQVGPVELFACTFRDGKGMSDLEKVNQKFRKWSDKNDPGYSAWTITPNFRMNDGKFDVGWIGSWQTGAEMGNGLDTWLAKNGGLADDYWDVIDCSHVLATSVVVNAPNGPPSDGVVWFSRCSVADGKTGDDAYAAHRKLSEAFRAMGGKGQSWLFYPALGFGKTDFDYLSVVSFNNYSELSEGWQMYSTGGGYEKAVEIMGGVVSCSSPNVYDARQVRDGQPKR